MAFDPAAGTWSSLRPPPEPMADADAVWTGSSAIFLETYGTRGPVTGQAFDPEADGWRPLPDAPIGRAYGTVVVWTGSDVIVWGGGDRSDRRSRQGAAYDPTTDRWRRIADAPFGLNLASGVWTGREIIVFGSLLDRRHRAATTTSVGEAYDPTTDTWRELPPSSLSAQATSAALAGSRLVAWDYAVRWQTFGLARERWSDPARMPMAPSECYPDSTEVAGLVFAWFCGEAALYGGRSWRRVHGGPLEETIYSDAYHRALRLWRSATLVPSGSVVAMAMQGITLDHKGVACYGCAGSPTSYWVYRPPEIL
jgi:hypothetical protein